MLCPEREENMARILSGKETASFINKRTSDTVRRLKERGSVPTLHILRVGENPADLSYERSAEKKCRGMEMEVEKTVFPEDVSGEAVLKKIRQLNEDKHVNGVLLFRPLPENLDAEHLNVILLLLLMSGSNSKDPNAALLTLGIYLFM